MAVIAHPEIDVVIEATGDPASGIKLCLAAIRHGKHIVMVNVEADALAGPLLARRAREAGVVYSLAWGDQPALIASTSTGRAPAGSRWSPPARARAITRAITSRRPTRCGTSSTQYLPIKDRSHINPKMFNSFLDGTKSGIEMTAVCNATGLVPQTNGLAFPPASRFELADVCKPRSEGGTLEKKGVTEVVSSLYRDGKDVPHHLAMGTYVVIESESPYAAQCFVEYNCLPDKSGRYATLYRPTHMIGLELGISVASAALRKEPTGTSICFNSDVAATAKRALKAGEMLDGEGGFTVWGKQVPADVSLKEGYLPLGLAHDVKLKSDIAEGQPLRWSDVAFDATAQAVKVRREMEAMFARPNRELGANGRVAVGLRVRAFPAVMHALLNEGLVRRPACVV